jgi:hypothetical protein
MVDTLGNYEQVMSDKGMQKMSLQIVDYILVTLHPCPRPNYMKEVMEKVLSYPRLNYCLFNYFLPTHLAKAQQEVFLGLNVYRCKQVGAI